MARGVPISKKEIDFIREYYLKNKEKPLIKIARELSEITGREVRSIRNIFDRKLSDIIQKRNIRFTEEQNQRILEVLNQNPYNLKEGFIKLSHEFEKSWESISVYWYMTLKHKVIGNKQNSFGIAGKTVHGSCKNIAMTINPEKIKELLNNSLVGINGFFYNSTTSTWNNNFTF